MRTGMFFIASVAMVLANVAPVQITHNADDAHIRIYSYCTIFLQLVYDVVKMRIITNTHADTHL